MRTRSGLRRNRIESDHAEVDAEGSWAVSYGDMVTLLLTFFILYFNVSQKTAEDLQKVQAVILSRLGTAASESSKNSAHKETHLNIGDTPDSTEMDDVQLRAWGGKATAHGSRILIEFPEISFFELGSVELSAAGKDALRKLIPKYLPFAAKNILSVKAFTDHVPVSAERSKKLGRRYNDNLELSAMRAIAAMRSLQMYGIPLDRMRISGYGEYSNVLRKVAAMGPFLKDDRHAEGDPFSRKVILMIEPDSRSSYE